MKKPKLLQFSKKELRDDFYPLFLNLIKKGSEIERMKKGVRNLFI